MTAVAMPTTRSKVTNGRRLFLEGIDGRSALARRFRDVLAGYRTALGRTPGPSEDAMLRTAASLTLRQEQLAGALASGERIDPGELTQLSSELRRVLRDLGLAGGKVAADPGPSLEDLLSEHQGGAGS